MLLLSKNKKMSNEKLKPEDLELPNYVNSKNLFVNLDVTDGVRAAVLAGLNILLAGRPGCGKTQLMDDIGSHWFGGNKRDGGNRVKLRVTPDTDFFNEVFTELNVDRKQRELTNNVEAAFFSVDEINNGPPPIQTQFFGLGDKTLDYKGSALKLGKDGFKVWMSTANLGNGEYAATFPLDARIYNRLHTAFDFDYSMFQPTQEDKFRLNRRKADPHVKVAKTRDITDKIIAVSKEIDEHTLNPGLETLAVMNYLQFGLINCQKNSRKEKEWPLDCEGCTHNPGNDAACSYLRDPVQRTVEATLRYAAALDFMAKLKDPKVEIDPIDLMFKSFELCGAYQLLLNPQLLAQTYRGQNPKFMSEAVKKLREDFKANEDYLLTSLSQAQKKGRLITTFYREGDRLGNYDSLSEKGKMGVTKIEPYTDAREIGLSWVKPLLDFEIKQRPKTQE